MSYAVNEVFTPSKMRADSGNVLPRRWFRVLRHLRRRLGMNPEAAVSRMWKHSRPRSTPYCRLPGLQTREIIRTP